MSEITASFKYVRALPSIMLYKLAMGDTKWLLLEDYGDEGKFIKVSIEDEKGGCVVLGLVEKIELKRVGKSF